MFWLCIAVVVILAHLIYLSTNSVNFKAFINLPFVRVVFVGGLVLFGVHYYANRLEFKRGGELPAAREPDEPQLELITQDELFYHPEKFIPYIITLKDRIRKDSTGNVSHPIVSDTWKENLEFWTLTCENRKLIAEPKDFNYSRLYLAQIHFMDKKRSLAEKELKETTIDLPFKSYLLAKVFYFSFRLDSAEVYFRKELSEPNFNVNRDTLYRYLLSTFRATNNYCGVLECVDNSPLAKASISIKEKNRAIFFCKGVFPYFANSWEFYFSTIDWFNWVLAFVVSLLWVVYFSLLDLFEKKDRYILILIALLEALCFFFIMDIWIDFRPYFFPNIVPHSYWQYYFCIVAFSEETIKIIPVIVIWNIFRKKFYEPYDVLMLGVVSACVFALVENSMYFNIYSGRILLARTLYACLTHIVCTSFLVYALILVYYRKEKTPIYQVLIFVFLSLTIHAAYDYFLEINAAFVSLVIYLFSLTSLAIFINNCLNNSPKFTYLVHLTSLRLTEILGYSIVGLIGIEYVISYHDKGTDFANVYLLENFGMNALFLFFIITKLSNFDLVKGFWRDFKFLNFGEDPEDSSKNWNVFAWFVKLLINNSNYPQNFVGLSIRLKPHRNNKMQHLLPSFFTGKFIGRAIVENESNGKSTVSEKWFVIMLHYPLTFDGTTTKILLMRFRNSVVPLDYINGQTVYAYQLVDLQELKEEVLHLKNFTSLGASVIKLIREVE